MKKIEKGAETPASAEKQPQPEPEKFWRVRFHVKRDANDTDEVVLAVQGQVLQIERDKVVVIPDRYKVCADNAVFPTFRQLPNESRKQVGQVRVYPYDLLGEAGEAEYLAMKATAPKAA